MSKIVLAAFIFFSIACNKPHLNPTHPPSALLSAENGYNKDALLAKLSNTSNNNNKNHNIDVIFLNHDDFLEKSKNLKEIFNSIDILKFDVKSRINSTNKCNDSACGKLCGNAIEIQSISMEKSVNTIFPPDPTNFDRLNLYSHYAYTVQEAKSTVTIKFSILINGETIFKGISRGFAKGDDAKLKSNHPDFIAFKNSINEMLSFLMTLA